jgi:hypothetical protein
VLEITAGFGDDPHAVGEAEPVPCLDREKSGRTYPRVTLQVGAQPSLEKVGLPSCEESKSEQKLQELTATFVLHR